MRTDDNLSRESFRFSEEWKRSQDGASLNPEIDQRLSGGELENGRYVVHSLSGHERNKLFMNSSGKSFADMSALSGLDNEADGRGFALLDYDRDGRQDIALVNANVPAFNLYRNAISQTGNVIAIQFEGANNPSSNAGTVRDGYGARAILTLPNGTQLKREHRCGEGFGSQNSATMLIGIGEATTASLKVKWPNGKVFELPKVSPGDLVLARENDRTPFSTKVYLRQSDPGERTLPNLVTQGPFTLAKQDLAANAVAPVRVYTTMATWCQSCLSHLPEVNQMCDVLAEQQVEIVALPIDEGDDAQKLAAYVEKFQPRYRLRADLTSADRESITTLLNRHLKTTEPPLPSTIVTDRDGNVIRVTMGLPTASEIRKLIRTP